MIEVYVIVEGHTEERFVKDLIAPAFRHLSVFLKPLLMNTSSSQKGGAVTLDRLKYHLHRLMKQHPHAYFTTFLDLYALDTDFPKFRESLSLDIFQRVQALQTALDDLITTAFTCRPERFFSHIQPYEFEGLLFSDVSSLVCTEEAWQKQEVALLDVRNSVATPEHINDGFETKPSKRLEKILQNPKYHKTRHGPLIARNITLSKIEQECSHFRSWMNRLRDLSV
ncbi:MAG: DUF4276 family protein [Formosimonas sp.]